LSQARPHPPRTLERQLARMLVRELSSALSPREARREVGLLLDELAAVLPDTQRRRVRSVVAGALSRWRKRGLGADAAARVLVALLAPADLADEVHDVLDPDRVLRSTLDAIPVPVLVGGPDLRVIVCNRAFEALAPGAHGAIAGLDVRDLLAPECRDDVIRRLGEKAGEGDAFQLDRVNLAAVPGVEFLASWIPVARPGRPGEWLLRLASGTNGALEALGERLRQEKTQNEKFAALLTVSNAVVNSLDLEKILDTIAHEVRQVIQVDECTVFVVDEAQGVLVPAACDVQDFRDEVMAIRLPIGQGVTGHVALTGKGQIVNDALNDPRAVQVPGTPVEQSSLLCVPLWVREKVAGAITLTRVGDRIFQDEDLELATLFAGQCGAAVSNARLYAETRRAYEELRETQSQLVQSAKLNALGEMAGGVAHDFNNILAAILGRTQLLLQEVSDPDVRRQLEVVEQAALDGAQAVRRVQEFTRVRQDEHFESLDPNEALLGVLELTRPAWEAESKRRSIAVATRLDLRATHTVAGNASELREVFTNLVLNAIDAMPWGGVLTLSSADEGEVVRVSVTDTGTGMDAETCSRVFDPFFTTKPVKGTGLGLSVAYGIISRHHGHITVESQPGKGSTFSVLLPGALPDAPVEEVEPPAPLPRLRLLAVDDEEPVLQVLGDLLRLLGQEVEVALGGAAGLERYVPGRFDAVFTDLGMPGVNGWDLALAVKALSPGLPIVIVTGWGAQIENQALQMRGADYVVPKPFSLEDVQDVLRQLGERLERAA